MAPRKYHIYQPSDEMGTPDSTKPTTPTININGNGIIPGQSVLDPVVQSPETAVSKSLIKMRPVKARKPVKKSKKSKRISPVVSDDSDEDEEEDSESSTASSELGYSEIETDVSSDSETDTRKRTKSRFKPSLKSKKALKKDRKRLPGLNGQHKARGKKAPPTESELSDTGTEKEDDDEYEDEESEESQSLDSDDDIHMLNKTMALLKAKLADARRTKSRKQSQAFKMPPEVQEPKPAASEIEFKRIDEVWDDEIHKFRFKETSEDPDVSVFDQYIFTVRRKFSMGNKHIETIVDIKSSPLQDALSEAVDGVDGFNPIKNAEKIESNMLFLYLEELRRHLKKLKRQSKTDKSKKARKIAAEKLAHLKVLVRYVDTDYADTKKTIHSQLESNMISFENIWVLFKPNTIVYKSMYDNPNEPRAFKVDFASKEFTFATGEFYSVEGRYLDFDGKVFGMANIEVNIDSFKGTRKITNLPCYPLSYHRDAKDLTARLIERGKKFVALAGRNYKYHCGMAYTRRAETVLKVNINGRIMVDPANHRRMNPNYPSIPVRPKEEPINSNTDDYSESTSLPISKIKYKPNQDEAQPGITNKSEKQQQQEEQQQEDANLTYEDLLISSPVVLGFGFNEKLWLEFSISGITDIQWNKHAFESLMVPETHKSLVKALVSSHTFDNGDNDNDNDNNGKNSRTIDDVIHGKGRGLVTVLHGPPGTGKTLTAEGIAEFLHRPLYTVSAGDLEMEPRGLELDLTRTLDIAQSWGAVLLLDEADVFLEQRTIQDLHRNALVSIFLRVLEYFQGVLFLTTNRVETFDEAFQSRIHVALRYGDLSVKAKRSVWKMFLDRVNEKEGVETACFTDKDLETLSRRAINGRQIKNTVRTAQALAIDENVPLSMDHIRRVLEVAETFDRDLHGGTGYMDAMRSYA